MSIRTKILLYFSSLTILLIGAVLLFIYTLFSNYREKEFQQEQNIKLQTTLKLLTAVKIFDKAMLESMDQITINSLYDEKLLIFDEDKKLIYSSIDDTPIPFYKNILDNLSPKKRWIEQKDSLYDVVGIYLVQNGKGFYGISKAYDISGYLTLNYIKKVLIISFISISVILFIMLYYLSGKITRSILHVTRQIKNFNFETNINPIVTGNTNDEIALLVKRFNQLMERMNKAYLFQKHAIHHISHELKTPISVLVSNFEKIEKEKNLDKIKEYIQIQKEDTKSLSEIINSLLEISKIESGKNLPDTKIRVDELLFDISEELNVLNPDFMYSIEYNQIIEDDNLLTVLANSRLLKAAFTNLMINSYQYSADRMARILISTQEKHLKIEFINNGIPISDEEQQFLFQHFFRGTNSKGKRGFGLGLVFVHKILEIHKGSIQYNYTASGNNIFAITLPLS
jgi:signal transduction histidine kinase